MGVRSAVSPVGSRFAWCDLIGFFHDWEGWIEESVSEGERLVKPQKSQEPRLAGTVGLTVASCPAPAPWGWLLPSRLVGAYPTVKPRERKCQ